MPSLPGAEFLFAQSKLALTSSLVMGFLLCEHHLDPVLPLLLSLGVQRCHIVECTGFTLEDGGTARLALYKDTLLFLSLRIEDLFLLDWSFLWW